jgi:transcriptional regulator EpsA
MFAVHHSGNVKWNCSAVKSRVRLTRAWTDHPKRVFFAVMRDGVLVQSRVELDTVLVNVEAAVKVKQRAHFFSWVQGVFQGMLAHEGLMCGLPHPEEKDLRFDWLGCYPASQDWLADVLRPSGGLMSLLIADWQRRGRVPLLLGHAPGASSVAVARDLIDECRRLELSNLAAHGLVGVDGQPAAFFAFFKLPAHPSSRDDRMLELVVPHLYAAWLRVNCAEDDQPSIHRISVRQILTAREVEILGWIERGKSNNAIGNILNISHLTVKNHVQKILRKLNAQNRAEAVASGMRMNLTHRDGGWTEG